MYNFIGGNETTVALEQQQQQVPQSEDYRMSTP